MRIVCAVCGAGEFMVDSLYIGKRMCDGYYTIHWPTADEANKFYEMHEHCGGTQDHFKIVYECKPDYEPA